MNNYLMERKGNFWILRCGTRIIYKSKDKAKVKSRYELLEGNRVDRQISSKNAHMNASMFKY